VPLTDAVTAALRELKATDYFFLTENELTKARLQNRPAQKFRESWEAAKRRAILADPSIPKEILIDDIQLNLLALVFANLEKILELSLPQKGDTAFSVPFNLAIIFHNVMITTIVRYKMYSVHLR
jgi:hypothetical protein